MLKKLQFEIRRRLTGRFRLRPGLPSVPLTKDIENEQAYYSKLLTTALPKYEQRQNIQELVDIGCRNWSYLGALANKFPNANLLGFELDGYRRYWNLYRRMDYAQAYASLIDLHAPIGHGTKDLKSANRKVEAIFGDFRKHPIPFHSRKTLFCFLFPFLSENPCLRWGLPAEYSDFSSLLKHSLKISDEQALHSTWVSVHQGDWEAETARRVYRDLGFSMKEQVLSPQEWKGIWPSPYENWIFTSS